MSIDWNDPITISTFSLIVAALALLLGIANYLHTRRAFQTNQVPSVRVQPRIDHDLSHHEGYPCWMNGVEAWLTNEHSSIVANVTASSRLWIARRGLSLRGQWVNLHSIEDEIPIQPHSMQKIKPLVPFGKIEEAVIKHFPGMINEPTPPPTDEQENQIRRLRKRITDKGYRPDELANKTNPVLKPFYDELAKLPSTERFYSLVKSHDLKLQVILKTRPGAVGLRSRRTVYTYRLRPIKEEPLEYAIFPIQ